MCVRRKEVDFNADNSCLHTNRNVSIVRHVIDDMLAFQHKLSRTRCAFVSLRFQMTYI